MTLSLMEAEYIVVLEACFETLLIKQVLLVLNIPTTLPTVIDVDNVSAISMASNTPTSQRMRHIGVCCHYIRKHGENWIVQIQFVHSKNHKVDVCTKSVNQEKYNDFIGVYETNNL